MRGVVPPENNVAPSLNVVMPRLQAGVVIEEPPPCHVRAYNAVTGFAWEVVAVSYIVVSSLFDCDAGRSRGNVRGFGGSIDRNSRRSNARTPGYQRASGSAGDSRPGGHQTGTGTGSGAGNRGGGLRRSNIRGVGDLRDRSTVAGGGG